MADQRNVGLASCEVIVQADHFIARLHEAINQVGAKEAGTASDEWISILRGSALSPQSRTQARVQRWIPQPAGSTPSGEPHRAQLVLTDHQGPRRTTAIGPLELLAESRARLIQLYPQPEARRSRANARADRSASSPRFTTYTSGAATAVNFAAALGIRLGCCFQHQQQPFHAKSPTDGGGWGSSQLADQAVITTTTTNGGLSPELITCDLKGRVTVVNHAPATD